MNLLEYNNHFSYIEETANLKSLAEITREIKSSDKAIEFVNEFKSKIASHLDLEPTQDLKPFLEYIAKLLSQNRKEMMNTFRPDVVKHYYEKLLVGILHILHEKHAFECQIFNAIKDLELDSFEQIKNSLVIKRTSMISEEGKEPSGKSKPNYVKYQKMLTQNVATELTTAAKSQTIDTSNEGTQNQINDI